jgi:hypothetical protein
MDAKSRETLRNAALAASQDGHARWQQRVTGELPTDPRPPVTRKPRGTSAAQQAEELTGLLTEKVDRLREATETELRHYLGKALADLAADTGARIAEVQYDGERSEVTDAYRAGLLLAARLVADPTFDY